VAKAKSAKKADKNVKKVTKTLGKRKGKPKDAKLYSAVKTAAKRKFDVYPSAYANAWVVREYKKRGGKYA